MSKAVKEMIMSDLADRIGESRDMLVVDASRLDAVSANRLRLALREKSITALTVRNSLARKALNDLGLAALDPVLQGPSTLVWGGEDIVALSKEMARWAKEIAQLEIKGGALEGSSLNAEDVERLSKSPSREELIGQVVGLILSPGAQLAAAISGPGATLASQLETIAEGEETPE